MPKTDVSLYLYALLYFRSVFGFSGWQAPLMAQPAHPQPQDDFPFLLLRTILVIDNATISIKTALMMIVAIFSIIHASIGTPPVFIIPAENVCSLASSCAESASWRPV